MPRDRPRPSHVCPREAGIGKTRLIEEIQRTATEAGFACHAALVLDFGGGVGRDAIRALVRSLLGIEVTSDIEAARAAAGTALSSDVVANDDAVFLNDLLNLPQPPELRPIYEQSRGSSLMLGCMSR